LNILSTAAKPRPLGRTPIEFGHSHDQIKSPRPASFAPSLADVLFNQTEGERSIRIQLQG
jgi:hypothetical protein